MRLVIFDIDGTLTQTTRVDERCFLRALAMEAITAVSTEWADYVHITDSGIAQQIFQERLGRAPSDGELERLQHNFVNLLADAFREEPAACVEVPGAADALRRLRRERGWAIAIATGGWRTAALLKLETARIEVDDVPAAFADDAVSREAIVSTALARAQARYGAVAFDKIVYVGDGAWDVRTAARLNLGFVGVGTERRAAELRSCGATHVIGDFTDYERLRHILEVTSGRP
jgi:phosphoglycolate phosphatase-like HAD superfamily hydrolase